MIFISRNIFNDLSTKELKKEYILESIPIKYTNLLEKKEIDEVVYGLTNIINNNEKLLDEVGFEKYLNEDYSAQKHVSGYFHRTGTVHIVPFDWSFIDNNTFEYSFTLVRNI